MATVFERVKKIVVEQLGVDEKDVVPTARFVDDLGADSLDLVELIMSLEEEFSNSSNRLKYRMKMPRRSSPSRMPLITSRIWVLKTSRSR